jgi:tetratricopeptide (TPR) repeat protein
MAEKGMDLEQVRNSIKGQEDKIGHLNKILKREGILTQKTKSSVYELLGEMYLKKGKESDAYDSFLKSKTKTAYMHLAEIDLKNGFYSDALIDLMSSGTSKKEAYNKIARAADKQGDYRLAAEALEHIGKHDLANILYKKDLLYSDEPAQKTKMRTLDAVTASIMVVCSIFLFAYFITLPQQQATQGAQLAPPMPSTLIIIVSLLLIAGVIYFMYTRAIKRMTSIPLSFE